MHVRKRIECKAQILFLQVALYLQQLVEHTGLIVSNFESQEMIIIRVLKIHKIETFGNHIVTVVEHLVDWTLTGQC